MNGTKISVSDLTRALDRFNGKYEVVEVFADDIAELQGAYVDADVEDKEDEVVLRFQRDDGSFNLAIDKSSGVARFTRGKRGLGHVVSGALVGGAVGAAIAVASSKKGEGWLGGLVLGLLAGAALGVVTEGTQPRRVFALRYDPAQRDWFPYDGGLVPWLKDNFRDQRSA